MMNSICVVNFFLLGLYIKSGTNICIHFSKYWQIALQEDCTNYNAIRKYKYTKLIASSEFVYELIYLLSEFREGKMVHPVSVTFESPSQHDIWKV